MENYISVSHWGMFPDIKCISNDTQTRFKEGFEIVFGLHLEEKN